MVATMDRLAQLGIVGAPASGTSPHGEVVLAIDCKECVGLDTSACVDCVVTHIIGHTPGSRVELGRAEVRQLELLADAGWRPNRGSVPATAWPEGPLDVRRWRA